MGSRVAVVGVGRVGLRVAWELSRSGYEVVFVDSSASALRRAGELVEGERRLSDAASPRALAHALRDADYAVVALPGGLGPRPLEGVLEAGVDTVDVSFYRDVPVELDTRARRAGVRVLLDAGVAPGLSNMLVAMARREAGPLREAVILVGGVSRDPRANPLGLAATWNAEDLIDEYLRPARMLRGGEVVSVDPLSSVCRVAIPGVGEMEAFPTDGLRSLLHTMKGEVASLAEYTLRHRGHVDLLAKLRGLGLLSDSPVHVDGCMVRPRALLARLIEESSQGIEDLVVLAVKAEGESGTPWAVLSIVEPEEMWSAMVRVTASYTFAALREALIAGAIREPGLHYPEELGLNGAAPRILEVLRSRGVEVQRIDPGEILVHECLETSAPTR